MGVPSEKLGWAVERIEDGVERIREISRHNPDDCFPDDLAKIGQLGLELLQLSAEIQQAQTRKQQERDDETDPH